MLAVSPQPPGRNPAAIVFARAPPRRRPRAPRSVPGRAGGPAAAPQAKPKKRPRAARAARRSAAPPRPVAFFSTRPPQRAVQPAPARLDDAPAARAAGGSPPKLRVDFDEYNIFHMNTKIRERLAAKQAELPRLQGDLERALLIEAHGLVADRRVARKKIVDLRVTIRDLEGAFEYALYLVRTHGILEEYKAMTLQARETSFLGPKRKGRAAAARPAAARLGELVAEYLRLARGYVELTNYTQAPQKLACATCGGTAFAVDETIYACTACATVREILDDSPTFKDSGRVNMCSRYTYSRRSHFIDAMKRYQARQNTTIPPEVYAILRRDMKAHGLAAETATMDHIYDFLEDNKLSAHYGDINLLFSALTGKKPRDISHLEPQLLELFEESEQVYEQIKDPDRVNSLNVNFKLLKLLQHLGHPCTRHDFYILKTAVKWCEHENKWEEIRVKKGWDYTPTVW